MEKLSRFLTALMLWALILLALSAATLRLGVAYIGFFKQDIETWLAQDLVPGISFDDLQGDWNHSNPILRLKMASITLPDLSQPLAVDEFVVEFGLWKSLRAGTPLVSEVSGSLASLSIKKDLQRHWWLNDISLGSTDGEGPIIDVEQLIQLLPDYLRLDLKQLVIADALSGEEYRIENIQADIQRRDTAIHLQLQAALPDSLGDQLSVKSILAPALSVVYLNSDRLHLKPIAALLGINTSGLIEADLGGEFWVNLIENRDVVLNGRLSISQGLLQANQQQSSIPFAVKTRLHAYQTAEGWRVNNRVEEFDLDDKRLEPFDSQLNFTRKNGVAGVQGWIEAFDLSNLLRIHERHLPENLARLIKESELKGQVSDLWFSLDPDDIQNLELSTRVSGFSSRPVANYPGIDALDGSILLGSQNARLELEGRQTEVDYSSQFRAPFAFDSLKASVSASLNQGNLLVSIPTLELVNPDIQLTARAWLEAEQGQKPFLYLRGDFAQGKGSAAAKYYPHKLLRPKTLAWLDRSIKDAEIPSGDFLFHGRLEKIKTLAQNYAGELQVGFEVRNAMVQFDPKWSTARHGAGRAFFHNLSLEVNLDSVQYDSIENIRARIAIESYVDALLEVDIETAAPLSRAWKTWIELPVGRRFVGIDKSLRNLSGEVEASVKLEIPLKNLKAGKRVDVAVEFNQAAIEAPSWGLKLDEINGILRASEKGLQADAITANYFQDPVIIGVSTDQANAETRVKVAGDIATAQLLTLLPSQISEGIDGKSAWQLGLQIPNSFSDRSRPIRIKASSSLVGSSVLFPLPFTKAADAARSTTIDLAIYGSERIDLGVEFGDQMKAQGQLISDQQSGLKLAVLDLGFGTELKTLSERGINLYGSLNHLTLDDWIAYYQTRLASTGQENKGLLQLFNSLDLRFQSFSIAGRNLSDTYLQLNRVPEGFDGTIDSSLAKGSFLVPYPRTKGKPIVANLEYLKLAKVDKKSPARDLLPGDLLDLRLRSGILTYNDWVFTDFKFDTRLEDDMLFIDTLSFSHNDITLQSYANWQYTADTGAQRSTLYVALNGKGLGQTISSIGLGDTLHDGEVNFEGQLAWSSSLLKMDWNSLTGDANLDIRDGVLKDIEPGSGRLVGLLSLNALPRRLSLDFKDVLVDGMQFDQISGTFKIEGENLVTTDTVMDGASARVKINGRTGLRKHDYDQQLIIVPKIRQTLPVIGSLAAGNAVGWGLLLLQKIFKKAIDKSVEIEYHVTGDWDNPLVELVRKTEVEQDGVSSEK